MDYKSEGFRRFDVKYGLGIKLFQKNDFRIAIISRSNSQIIDEWSKSLGIKILRKRISCQLKTLKEIKDNINIKVKQTIFLGDDINDLTVFSNIYLYFHRMDILAGKERLLP